MKQDDQAKHEMLKLIPNLRGFAVSLSGNQDRADDLVQETLLKAWSNIEKFDSGTNMAAWLFTILRNLFYSEHRKRRREVQDADGHLSERMISLPEQHGHLDLADFNVALQKLSSGRV